MRIFYLFATCCRELDPQRLKINSSLTQKQIATKAGQEGSTAANTVRLLDLPEKYTGSCFTWNKFNEACSYILSLKDQEKQIEPGERIATDGLSVRDAELIVSDRKAPEPSTEETSSDQPKPLTIKSPHILDLEDGPRKAVGLKVTTVEKSGKERITIEFAGNSQFENIAGKLKAMMKPPSDTPQKRDASSPRKASSSKKSISCREQRRKDKQEDEKPWSKQIL